MSQKDASESVQSPTKASAVASAPPEPNATDLNASLAATAAGSSSNATSSHAPASAPTASADAAVAANSHRVKELRLHFPSGEQLVEIEETGPHDDDEVYQRLIEAASASSLAQNQRVKRFLLPLTPKQISILPNGAIIIPEFDSALISTPGRAGAADSSFYSPAVAAAATAASAETLADVNAGLPSDIKLAVAKAEEIDTKAIATRVQELLASHHISQAAFSENIVKLTQGALSNLLNKPKPWSALHNSGRQPYLRMKLWLEEDGFEKRLAALIKLQHERRGQRKRPLTASGISPAGDSGSGISPARRVRHTLTEEQKSGLQELYAQNNRPSREELTTRALELDLPFNTVSNWFHNQRAKANRMKMETSQSQSQGQSQGQSQDQSEQDEEVGATGAAAAEVQKDEEDAAAGEKVETAV